MWSIIRFLSCGTYIDDEYIHLVKGDGYDLICDPGNPYGTSTDHEYYFIRDDLFGRILDTDQNSDIVLNGKQRCVIATNKWKW